MFEDELLAQNGIDHDLCATSPAARRERANCGTGFIAHLSARPSNAVLRDALSTLNRLAHRGAIAADAKTGDGAGVLTQIPRRFFARELAARGLTAPPLGDFAVGVFFLPRADIAARVQAKQIVESTLIEHNLPLLTWRAVPIDLDALGDHARSIAPHIEQAIIARPPHIAAGDAFERRLVLARKEIERRARVAELTPLYIPLAFRAHHRL